VQRHARCGFILTRSKQAIEQACAEQHSHYRQKEPEIASECKPKLPQREIRILPRGSARRWRAICSLVFLDCAGLRQGSASSVPVAVPKGNRAVHVERPQRIEHTSVSSIRAILLVRRVTYEITGKAPVIIDPKESIYAPIRYHSTVRRNPSRKSTIGL
jgi:hypothetical protein